MSNPEARMTFTEHLAELRTRLIRSIAAVGICFLVAYGFHEKVFDIVAAPLRPLKDAGVITEPPPEIPTAATDGPNPAAEAAATPPRKPQTIDASKVPWTILNPLESFIVQLRLSAYVGLVLALPIVIYQLCSFIFPGLTPRERNMARILLIGSTFFVIFGVCVAYFGVFPLVLPYLMSWVPDGVTLQLRMSETISLIIKGMLGFAAAFQFPMVVLVLVYLDLLSPATLRKYRKFAIVVMAILSAILTPPDPISMTVMLVPLVILYEMSIWISYVIIHRKKMAVPLTES